MKNKIKKKNWFSSSTKVKKKVGTMTKKLIELNGFSASLIDWLDECSSGRSIDWCIARLIDWLILFYWMDDWLIDWLILFYWMDDWLIDWLIRFVGWMTDWLIDWSDLLVVCVGVLSLLSDILRLFSQFNRVDGEIRRGTIKASTRTTGHWRIAYFILRIRCEGKWKVGTVTK